MQLVEGKPCLMAGHQESGSIVVPHSEFLAEELHSRSRQAGQDPKEWVKLLLSVATMSFNDLEKKRIENALDNFLAKRRPPPHIRKELDLGYALAGQSVELLEIRPQWDDPSITHRRPFAKATYVQTRGCWKVFWMRASLKWQGYEPTATVSSIDEFLAVVDRDQYGCFWG